MAKLTKEEQKEFQRQRAKWEFSIRLSEFIGKFKSNEEPSVKLTEPEIIEVLAQMVARNIKDISK